MVIVPLAGRTSPASALTSVLFPAPFGPTRATISPLPTDRLTPSKAVADPQRTTRSAVLSTALLLAEVGLYHGRVSRDLAGRAFGYHLAQVEHCDHVGKPGHETDVMLDEHHRQPF